MIKDTDLIFNEYLIGIVFSIMKFQLFLLSPLSSLLSPLSSLLSLTSSSFPCQGCGIGWLRPDVRWKGPGFDIERDS
jgi:hypothetical protein